MGNLKNSRFRQIALLACSRHFNVFSSLCKTARSLQVHATLWFKLANRCRDTHEAKTCKRNVVWAYETG